MGWDPAMTSDAPELTVGQKGCQTAPHAQVLLLLCCGSHICGPLCELEATFQSRERAGSLTAGDAHRPELAAERLHLALTILLCPVLLSVLG